MRSSSSFVSILIVAAAPAVAATATAPAAAEPAYSISTIDLGTTYHQGFFLDYLAYDASTDQVWVPAGATGEVDVIEGTTVRPIGGFATREVEMRGAKRTIGPSSASVGEGVVYVGNRADQKICAVDAKTLTIGTCGTLDAMPDGVAYVRSKHEVWVTTPRDRSIRILDATTLAEKAKLTFDGSPEGFAVDDARGRFYTNLEDKDRTLAIDLGSHATLGNFDAGCGEEGPRGLRIDERTGLLFVACTRSIETMDAAHDGRVISTLATGEGVDDPDFDATNRMLYAAASRAAKLTIARVDDAGNLSRIAEVATKPGARNGVVTKSGAVYMGRSNADDGADVVVVSPGR